jgi:APA family basic amino acid/polyamine antiporter
MVGTGVFVSIGLGAGVAGPAILPAILVAALVALCNGMSSAQLAAAHPVSGGTYEYGYRFLKPWLGFAAGWMFLCAKSASAATAALGFSGYLLHLTGFGDLVDQRIPALLLLGVLSGLVASGLRRTARWNSVIVGMTLLSLVIFVGTALQENFLMSNLRLSSADLMSSGFLEACALMFVAYTGYGRIATMGEEVKDPRRTIPKAIFVIMVITAILYWAVAVAAVGAVGSEVLGDMTLSTAAPLEMVLQELNRPWMAGVVAVGALTAMIGVILNLVLGLSRVLLAMGRRRDMPATFAVVKNGSPVPAVVGVSLIIGLIILSGSVRLSWSFSAFTVLTYYALTNLAALRLPQRHRLYPRVFSYGGLAACVFLAFQVSVPVWTTGLALLALGLSWHVFSVSLRRPE